MTETPVENPKTDTTTPANTKPTKEAPVSDTPETAEEPTLLGKEKASEVKTTAPEKYEVKLKDMEVDSVLLESLTPVLKKHGVTNEALQELATVYAPHIQQLMQTQQQQALDFHKEQVDGWKADTLKNLGTTAKQDLALASRFIDRFGTAEVREILDATGLGNHPEVVKLFVNAGKAISEDAFVEPTQTNTPSQDQMLKTMYPKMTGKK